MIMRRIQFQDGQEVDITVADAEANNLFRAASIAFLQPFALAAQSGRLSEERSTEILAKVYAEAVVCGSPTPGLTELTTKGWEAWLVGNPEKFATLRAIAEVKRNFDPNAESPNAQPGTSPAAGSGSEPTS